MSLIAPILEENISIYDTNQRDVDNLNQTRGKSADNSDNSADLSSLTDKDEKIRKDNGADSLTGEAFQKKKHDSSQDRDGRPSFKINTEMFDQFDYNMGT